jgi:hypothetical protein
MRALEIFRGPLPPQRSARKDDCLSAKRKFRLCSEARRCRVGKMSNARKDQDVQGTRDDSKNLLTTRFLPVTRK